jgi:transposase
MRGADQQQSGMFSYISAERRVPKEHPLRTVRVMVDAALKELGSRFAELYASGGRPSIAPEKLLRALLLQVLYTVRSERMLMEQLDYNFLFRWFVGLSIDDPVWDVTVFTKNRERLLKGEVAQGFFHAVVEQARAQGLLSDEHFTVDGTLIEAWAGHKSFKRKADDRQTPPDDPGNPSVDFHGERRRNATHQSTTDPEARLARKGAGKEAKLSYAGHVEMDNRHGLVVPRRPWRWWKRSRALAESRWAPTRATIKRSWCGSCASIGLRRTLRRSRTARSMAAPPAARDIGSASGGANGSRRSSAGSRPWAGCAKLVIVESLESAGPSPLLLPPTTWLGCAT